MSALSNNNPGNVPEKSAVTSDTGLKTASSQRPNEEQKEIVGSDADRRRRAHSVRVKVGGQQHRLPHYGRSARSGRALPNTPGQPERRSDLPHAGLVAGRRLRPSHADRPTSFPREPRAARTPPERPSEPAALGPEDGTPRGRRQAGPLPAQGTAPSGLSWPRRGGRGSWAALRHHVQRGEQLPEPKLRGGPLKPPRSQLLARDLNPAEAEQRRASWKHVLPPTD